MEDDTHSDPLDSLTAGLTQLHVQPEVDYVSAEDFVIVIEGHRLTCSKELLRRNSEFFAAFLNFDPDKTSIDIHGGGGLDLASCEKLLNYWQTGQLDVNGGNAQALLQGATYLQSSRAEAECVAYMTGQLGRENAFPTLHFADQVAASTDMRAAAHTFIERTFAPVLLLFSRNGSRSGGGGVASGAAAGKGMLASLLAATAEQWRNLLNDNLQVSEELLFYALLGWIEHTEDARKNESTDLLHMINFCLMSKTSLEQLLQDESDLLARFPEIRLRLQQSIVYHNLSLDQQEAYWTQRPDDVKRRWPRILIAFPTGTSQACIEWLDLSRAWGPGPLAWRRLSRKPAELRANSMGCTLVYRHPRAYFLGGERSWQLIYYDLELDRWGVCQGVPPGRLLAGACVLEDNIYLIGGVSIEEWGRGGKSVVTASGVDRYNLSTSSWEEVCPLPEGRSSPCVAAFGGVVYVFGGLRGRYMMTNVFKYSPNEDVWHELAGLPERICYAATVVDLSRGGLWLLGGKDCDLKARKDCYFFHALTHTWTRGPDLLLPRQAAFGFQHAGSIYICGGSTDGLNFVDATEVLKPGSDCWERSNVGCKFWKCRVFSAVAQMPLRFNKAPT